ncbi:MAG: TolC family protein [Planctomycetota bacterium]
MRRSRELLMLVAVMLPAAVAMAGCSTPFDGEPIYMPAMLHASGGGTGAGTAGMPGTNPGVHGMTPPPADGPLTLQACIDAAFSSSRRITMAERSTAMAQDRVNEAIGTILPSISASVTAETRSNKPGVGSFSFGKQSTVHGDFTLLVPIYDFGVSSNQRDILEAQVRQSKSGSTRTRQDLRFNVTQAWFRVLEAQRILQVVDESIKVVETQLAIAQDFLKQQLVAKNDVLAVQAQLASRQQERISAEHNRLIALAALARLTGIDTAAVKNFADVADDEQAGAPAQKIAPFEQLVVLAIQSRGDILQSAEGVGVAQSQYRSTRSSFLPTLYAWGAFLYTSDDTQSHKEWWTAGAKLSLPVFNLDRFFRLDRNEREIAQAVDSHRELLDDVVLQVREALLAVENSTQQVPVARLGVELADENLRIERDQYREGLRTSADVLIAEQRLASARSSYYQALYGQHIALARLANVVGVDQLP